MFRYWAVLLFFALATSRVFAPPESFRRIVLREMSKAEIAQFASLIRDLHPDQTFANKVDPEAPPEIQYEVWWEAEREFQRAGHFQAELAQKILPQNIVRLAEAYPSETIQFINSASEHEPPMSRQLNALLAAIHNRDVRRAAANCLVFTLEEDTYRRETVFRHLLDPDPDIRRALGIELNLRINAPFSAEEQAKVVAYQALATEEGNAQMQANAARILAKIEQCLRVHRATADEEKL